MANYTPVRIAGYETGLVKEREDYLLTEDAFPVMENAYIFREKILKKKGTELIARLRRLFTSETYFETLDSPWIFNLMEPQGYVSDVDESADPTNTVTTTYDHGLSTGDQVMFSEIVGSTELNGNSYTVTVVTATTFTVQQAGVSAYTSGGIWFSSHFGVITGVNVAGDPTIVITTSADHNLSNGDEVKISGVVGSTELNGNTYTVANVAATTFEVTQAGTSAYTSDGYFVEQIGIASEPNAMLECGTFTMTIASEIITDDGDGTLTGDGGGGVTDATGTINYLTGAISLTHGHVAGTATTITYAYFPGLPCMGLRLRELTSIALEDTVAFDTKYSYILASNKWQEFIPGTVWQNSDSDFFSSTNFWTDSSNNILFWVTNFTRGSAGDPIRYTDGTTWTDFAPDIDGTNFLQQARIMLPFRGRMFVAHTWEGTSLTSNTEYRQRLRWAQIGNPTSSDAWVQTVRGKGNYLDIPTSETIMDMRFIRDDLIVFCERSTWIVRHTGRSIQPFYVEKRNTELGGISAFTGIEFDTSVMAIGDKRIARATPQEVAPADDKIPDLALKIEESNEGYKRVHGMRDIPNKTAYWIYNDTNAGPYQQTYPNRRLMYNYENDTWAIFKDYFTCLGQRWLAANLTWADVEDTWADQGGTWEALQSGQPVNIAGNHHGYVFDLEQPDQSDNSNDPGLYITAITGNTTTATTLTIPNHNLETHDFVRVSDIPATTGYATALNGIVFRVRDATDANTIELETWDTTLLAWQPQLDASATYVGCGQAAVMDNFRVVSKKFNHSEEGEKIQIGFVDILTSDTTNGEFIGNVYADYNEDTPLNDGTDGFFNNVIPTTNMSEDVTGSSRSWHRFFCPTRSNMLSLEWTLSDAQMVSEAGRSAIEIHGHVVWKRKAGR